MYKYLKLPYIEQTLAQLGAATVFSKWGSLQVELTNTADYFYNSLWSISVQWTSIQNNAWLSS